MKLIRATEDDIDEIAQFARETFRAAYIEDVGPDRIELQLKEQMSDAQFIAMAEQDVFFMARQNAQLVGFAQYGAVDMSYETYVSELDASALELRRLYVLTSLQSQGIGGSLLQEVLTDGKTEANNFYLTTWESNRAQALYKRHGFNKVGEIPEYTDQGHLSGYEHIMYRPRG